MTLTGDVAPADVYEQVKQLQKDVAWVGYVLYGVLIAVAVQVVAKVVIFRRVLSQSRRTERLLDLASQHGDVTDNQKDRSARLLDKTERVLDKVAEAQGKVAETAATVAQQVAEKVETLMGLPPGSTSDSAKLRTVNPGPTPQGGG